MERAVELCDLTASISSKMTDVDRDHARERSPSNVDRIGGQSATRNLKAFAVSKVDSQGN